MRTVELWAKTQSIAADLDVVTIPGPPHLTGVAAIESVIRSTAGGWPGGGSGEPVSGGGLSDPTASAAIRRLTTPGRDDLADLAALHREVARFVAAVGAISRKCVAAPMPTNWDEAITDANLLSTEVIEAALDVGVDLWRDVDRAFGAVVTIQRIHDGHCRHKPDGFVKIATSEPVCRSHARIGDYDRPRYRDFQVCRTCHDLIAEIGNPSELDKDPDAWPTIDVLREYAHMENTGMRVDYRRVRQAWIESKTRRRSA